jgi:hypothetical protein
MEELAFRCEMKSWYSLSIQISTTLNVEELPRRLLCEIIHWWYHEFPRTVRWYSMMTLMISNFIIAIVWFHSEEKRFSWSSHSFISDHNLLQLDLPIQLTIDLDICIILHDEELWFRMLIESNSQLKIDRSLVRSRRVSSAAVKSVLFSFPMTIAWKTHMLLGSFNDESRTRMNVYWSFVCVVKNRETRQRCHNEIKSLNRSQSTIYFQTSLNSSQKKSVVLITQQTSFPHFGLFFNISDVKSTIVHKNRCDVKSFDPTKIKHSICVSHSLQCYWSSFVRARRFLWDRMIRKANHLFMNIRNVCLIDQ